ncbi:uncharacterized protein Z519_01029 [Cladophialophora bantiana CBS 173.52]|uniref:Uncharacterized protein n=1 Tax=Cladophialophora bantiana (strain ATCC 10958 / CBS 173.52 / CDC B-1940 / NIH 8579) TaxID=1442370 RepID=A0A0D2I2P0_CLAB1|nr:uncharacterized protein Z519_01029 [Cladophialophora bantiana CBS 173.52]KIW97445.1 hypothetical protein Z519_01029 [Cladophialophora bantiana CBS 173.52]
MASPAKCVFLAGIALATVMLGQDCGRLTVFTDRGASLNSFNCDAFIDDAMMPFLAWFNGTTTLALTGGLAAGCPDTTWQPLKNSWLIGGMTVPGNATLDRTKYDNNTFYFDIPKPKLHWLGWTQGFEVCDNRGCAYD